MITSFARRREHSAAAAAVVGLLLLAALAVALFGGVQLPENLGFMPAFAAATLVCNAITGVLLFTQSGVVGNRALAGLGCAYFFAMAAIVPYVLASPDVFAAEPLIGTAASAVWLWCAWHAGFALGVARYTLLAARARPPRTAPLAGLAIALGAVLVCSLAATVGLSWLPPRYQGLTYAQLLPLGLGPMVLACNAGALALVVRRLRCRTKLGLWLSVAMLTATLDVAITLFAGDHFTLGWYAARLLSLGTGIVVLVALLSDISSAFRQMAVMNRQLQALAVTDPLTELANRRGFDSALDRAWRTARREETVISLITLDIDWFKGFNDSYGHPAGDDCLRRVAAVMRQVALRPGDLQARVGGEEFSLLMPATEQQGAALMAERVRAGVEALAIPHRIAPLGRVTVSLGVATMYPAEQDAGPAALVTAADQALYAAKSAGRNRVCTAPDTATQQARQWQAAAIRLGQSRG